MPFQPLLLVVLLARPATAQVLDTTHRVPGAAVSGVVRDSVARIPLAGATVQLVVAGNVASLVRTAVSDSMGRFTLGDVPGGRYMLGFFHPALDSLGVDAPMREVYVEGERPVRADLAIPSPARIRAAICGPRPALDSSGVLIGVVRDAHDGAPAAGVTVTGEWLELSLTRGAIIRRIRRLDATTGENGWFAMCNVPSAGMMALIASRGADSTDRIEFRVPAEGFLRRELYIGPARTVVSADTTQRADASTRSPRRLHVGDARLSGTVIAAAGGRPLMAARVSITAGPETRTNERGEWTLVDAPVGTRMLEVRAVGYYPELRPVNVVAGAPPVRVALSTLKAVLDTVKVVAARRFRRHELSGFQERRRTSVGHYLTSDDIARRNPILVSDLFHAVPGLRLDRTHLGGTVINMRGIFEERCAPNFYLDGHYMRELSAEDVDDWVRPIEVAGIEVYAPGTVPAQFEPGQSGCGSIVIWTK
jgi:hypothetical protein